MEISRNKFVKLTYTLRRNAADGELVEETTAENALEFIFGTGKMLPMFEEKLESLEAGAAYKIEIPCASGYGEVNEEAKVDIPKNIFEVDGAIDEKLIKVGNFVPMQDAQGNRLNGIVLDINEENVKMDFNHPLAGDDLFFTGEVLEVREATEDELVAAVGGGGCGSCNCGEGDGGCSSSCGCGEEEGSCDNESCNC